MIPSCSRITLCSQLSLNGRRIVIIEIHNGPEVLRQSLDQIGSRIKPKVSLHQKTKGFEKHAECAEASDADKLPSCELFS